MIARSVEFHQAGAVSDSEPRQNPHQLLEVLTLSCGGRRRKGKTTVQNFKNTKKIRKCLTMKMATTKTKNISKDTPSLNIMHCNAEGVSPKPDALTPFLRKHNIDIRCIQKTHLKKETSFEIKGYQCIRKDREGRRK